MLPVTQLPDALAINPQGLDKLRLLAKQGNEKEALRAGAQQFESYFLQMMLKSMRETMPEDGPFDSQEVRSFTEMSDQQLAQNISRGKGVGLTDMLVKQLSRASDPNAIHVEPRSYNFVSGTLPGNAQSKSDAHNTQAAPTSAVEKSSTPGNFIDKLWPHAAAAGKEIGVAPHLLLGQAALESGWGKQAPRMPDGSSSHNLFNIKAGPGWKGAVVQTETTEYVNGIAQKSMEKFRAYASDAEAFADYANLLKNSRYANAVQVGNDANEFAQGLQSGGYATDPMYADKLVRLINSASFRTALLGDQSSLN